MSCSLDCLQDCAKPSHEAHITVECPKDELALAFALRLWDACSDMPGVRPLVIANIVWGSAAHRLEFMTQSTHASSGLALEASRDHKDRLKEKGFVVSRRKIEGNPFEVGAAGDPFVLRTFETHASFQETPSLMEYLGTYDIPTSRSLTAKLKGTVLVTFRARNTHLREYEKYAGALLETIFRHTAARPLKARTEWVWYDTNPGMDDDPR